MKIWLINHYAVPPQYYPLARPSLFAKNLIKMGHNVTIIAASTVHNSDCQNLIEDGSRVKHITEDGISYVLINCKAYKGNGKDRVINILQFAKRLTGILNAMEKPDAILATSFDPLTCWKGVKYAKKKGIKIVAEIADLWPETLVAYNGVNTTNPIVKYLRRIEKKIYTKADRIIFTMEGAYEYIIEQGWENEIPRSKVFFINNGIDTEEFEFNKEHYQIEDPDLVDQSVFKVIYAGAIRKVNNLSLLLDAAKLLISKPVKFLIWGDGDELDILKKRIQEENISNVVLKGRVQKKYVPYIVSNADLNILLGKTESIFRFGISPNKMFDYFASGKPQLVTFDAKYNPVDKFNAGLTLKETSSTKISEAILEFLNMSEDKYREMCDNAHDAAASYNFKELTGNLIKILS